MNAFASQVENRLRPLADPARAVPMAAYMKGHFPFLGIATPVRRQATHPLIRDFKSAPVPEAEALWALPEREFQYVAVDLLRRKPALLNAEDFPALIALVERKSWWDTVDGLAVVIGNLVRRNPSLVGPMDELLVSPKLWLRRVALLHQLEWKRDTHQERLFAYCLQCADERDFFIRKAIGWALRQYARCAPEAVGRFLAENRNRLSTLSVREAGKHLGA